MSSKYHQNLTARDYVNDPDDDNDGILDIHDDDDDGDGNSGLDFYLSNKSDYLGILDAHDEDWHGDL